MAILEGFLVGLSMIIFIGPVLFYLVKTTLDAGFWAGVIVALSVVIGDLLCIVICSWGAIPLFKDPNNQFWLAAVGGIILLAIGIKYIIRPQASPNEKTVKTSYKSYLSYFTQGFLINFVNPFVFIVWIGVIGYAQTSFNNQSAVFLFLAFALLGVFATDMTKVFFAQKIKKLINTHFLTKLYRFFGILLILFGFRLLFHAFG